MKNSLSNWRKAVVYQVYPLSFQDANGDGIGDLQGILSRLDHIQELGADVIWLSPIYQSPMDDNGYDISDYYAIHPMFGNFDDFQALLQAVHERGMKLIMDLVVNHTSDEHVWFQQARSSKDNPYRDYYVWRKEKTDIGSVFSGSAWEWDPRTEEYYFHLFSKKQPDLNWQNPKLRQEIYKMINWWLDLGIDGFRLDVIDLIGKDIDRKQLGDGPYLDYFLEEMHQACFAGRDVFTVGEMPTLSMERAAEVTNLANPKLSMIFQFGHLGLDEIPGMGKWALKKLDLVEFKHYYERMQHGLFDKGWNSLFFENHDQPRCVSRYGSEDYRLESAKMLATFLYGMQGTPYVYQGQEIGAINAKFPDLTHFRDIETINMAKEYRDKGWSEDEIMASLHAKSRDNARIPMAWDASKFGGFSSQEPWLECHPRYQEINVTKDQSNPNGVFHYFQKLLALRKQHLVFLDGDFTLVWENHPSIAAYLRQNEEEQILIITSFSNQEMTLDASAYQTYEVLLANQEAVKLNQQSIFPPYYAAIYRQRRSQ